MKKKPTLLFGILAYSFLIFFSTQNIAAHLNQQLDALIQHALPNATVGVYIQNVDGKEVYSHHADTILSPASNMKLYTAAAALYSLGADYRYTTSVSQLKDDVYLTFSGAPDLMPLDLQNLLQHILSIKGNLIIDASQFSPPVYPAGASYDDLGWYYTPPCTAVILNQNMVEYGVITPQVDGQRIQLLPKQKKPILTIENDVKTIALAYQSHCTFNITIKPNNTLHLFGCLVKQKQPTSLKFSIPDPVFYAKQLIKTYLKENHILLHGNIIEGHTPKQATRIATHPSASLAHLLDHMMKHSDNLYADSVTRTLGYKLTHEGTTKQGTYAISQILTANAAMDMRHIELADGIGTRYNLSSPKHIATLLNRIYHHPQIYSTFIQTLPVMGVSGSLQNRMKGTPLENHVFAKTGTMHDISALSGFIKTSTGKTLVFSIIINGITTNIHQAKQLEEKILQAVMKN